MSDIPYPDWWPVCTTEEELDEVLGPITDPRFSKPVIVRAPDWRSIDPLAWPTCKVCGMRRPELMVERGFECAYCTNRWVSGVLSAFRPFRRTLPDVAA